MPGIAGGGTGAPNELTLRAGTPHEQIVETTAFYVAARGRRALRVPLRRRRRLGRSARSATRRQVLDDVLDEYVSVEGARRDYGVVLTGTLEALDLAIDHARDRRRCAPSARRCFDRRDAETRRHVDSILRRPLRLRVSAVTNR